MTRSGGGDVNCDIDCDDCTNIKHGTGPLNFILHYAATKTVGSSREQLSGRSGDDTTLSILTH